MRDGLYFVMWDLILNLCELQSYYKGTDLHKLSVQVMMVRDVHNSHTTMVALLLTNKSLCPPASVTDQIYKASARICLALLNVVLFHYFLAENSSLIISYLFSQPASSQSLHYFPDIGFVFYLFYF